MKTKWNFKKENIRPGIDEFVVTDNDNNFITSVSYEDKAKLIASAPELLENLIRCVDRLEENDMGDMSAVRRAKEVIYKANTTQSEPIIKSYKCTKCNDSGWLESKRMGYDSIMGRCECKKI